MRPGGGSLFLLVPTIALCLFSHAGSPFVIPPPTPFHATTGTNPPSTPSVPLSADLAVAPALFSGSGSTWWTTAAAWLTGRAPAGFSITSSLPVQDAAGATQVPPPNRTTALLPTFPAATGTGIAEAKAAAADTHAADADVANTRGVSELFWRAWTGVVTVYQNARCTLLVLPMERLYRYGPALHGYGFWRGASSADICAALTGVGAGFWQTHTSECDGRIRNEVESFAVLCESLLYFAFVVCTVRRGLAHVVGVPTWLCGVLSKGFAAGAAATSGRRRWTTVAHSVGGSAADQHGGLAETPEEDMMIQRRTRARSDATTAATATATIAGTGPLLCATRAGRTPPRHPPPHYARRDTSIATHRDTSPGDNVFFTMAGATVVSADRTTGGRHTNDGGGGGGGGRYEHPSPAAKKPCGSHGTGPNSPPSAATREAWRRRWQRQPVDDGSAGRTADVVSGRPPRAPAVFTQLLPFLSTPPSSMACDPNGSGSDPCRTTAVLAAAGHRTTGERQRGIAAAAAAAVSDHRRFVAAGRPVGNVSGPTTPSPHFSSSHGVLPTTASATTSPGTGASPIARDRPEPDRFVVAPAP